MTKFAVVEFPEEKRVAIVPSSWLMQNGKLCMWPPRTWADHRITSAVKSLKPPQSGWVICQSRRMSKCDNYGQALRRQERCQYTSHCDTTDVDTDCDRDNPSQGVVCAPVMATFEGPTVPDGDSPGVTATGNHPLPLPPRGQLTALPSASQDVFTEVPDAQLRNSPGLSDEGQSVRCSPPSLARFEPLHCSSSFDNETDHRSSPVLTVFERNILRHLARMKQHNKEVLDALENLHQGQTSIMLRLTQLEQQNKQQQNKSSSTALTAEDLGLPLKTLDQFMHMEEVIQEKAQYEDLKRYLSVFGGTSLEQLTRTLVSRLMSPMLQLQFNMNGKKGTKTAFKGTRLCTLITGAIMQKLSGHSELTVEQAIGKFLAGARDRDGGRKKRNSGVLLPLNENCLPETQLN